MDKSLFKKRGEGKTGLLRSWRCGGFQELVCRSIYARTDDASLPGFQDIDKFELEPLAIANERSFVQSKFLFELPEVGLEPLTRKARAATFHDIRGDAI